MIMSEDVGGLRIKFTEKDTVAEKRVAHACFNLTLAILKLKYEEVKQ